MTAWFCALTSIAGTLQRAAAACSSMVLAAAPALRMGRNEWRMLREPSVSWLPYLASSPSACSTRTWAKSASSSSARTKARLVLIP